MSSRPVLLAGPVKGIHLSGKIRMKAEGKRDEEEKREEVYPEDHTGREYD